jgi:signal peptidase I
VEQNFEKRYRFIREIMETIVLTVLMFVIINLAVQNYDIQGPSMEPTLHNQERIMVDKVSYLFHPPSRGDIIVFIAPNDPALNYVKRIIAIPGDVISVDNTTVKVDGVTLQESYVDPGRQGNPYEPIDNRIVPPNDYFVMGDDRVNSSDSRDWGFVPRGNIIGRAALVYWPLGQDNSGFVHNYSSVFAKVHPSNASSTSAFQNRQTSDPSGVDVNEMFLCLSPTLLVFSAWYRKRRSRRGALVLDRR